MKCVVAGCILGLGLIGLVGGAQAQAVYNRPDAGGGYGGGFIELLVTGQDPQPRGGAIRQATTAYAPPLSAAAYGDRSMAAPYRSRLAALPQDPGTGYEGSIMRGPDPRFQRQEVAFTGRHAPGTIVIDTPSKYLCLVQSGGRAIRYGIGVGRPGFEWAGTKTVSMKREWPDWTPPAEMRKRRPDLPAFMQGGPANPLGARALYLGSSLYRIHGTNEPHTIGQSVSSGCIRMMNEDVTDLYERVRVGTRVHVI